ncbi:hypothetical protein C2E23DRAFT_717283 [Lenzites betulinus]|nr:hypothetical protein C2E23DRAFT_717283 [Lenzites betulinus]
MPLTPRLAALFWAVATVTWVVRPSSAVFAPASIPLAVRSPYMSVWYNNANGSVPLSQSLPLYWGQQQSMGWVGKIRVDSLTYSWMGSNETTASSVSVVDVQITATRSIFIIHAGPMNLTVTFLSPIEPSDWVLQSLPFSYVSVDASSLDGKTHDVQLYSDITSDWVSGSRVESIQWSHTDAAGYTYHQVNLTDPQPFAEENTQARDGVAYYAMGARPGLTWQIGNNATVRGQFDSSGVLTNVSSTPEFGNIQVNHAAFAIAVDLGQIQSTSTSITWMVGFVRNPTIMYTAPDGSTEPLSPYFVTKYGNDIGSAIRDLTSGFGDTVQRAVAFDNAVIANASQISQNYSEVVSLAARQTMASLDLTVSLDSDGNANASDVRIFMKDIGAGTILNPPTQCELLFPDGLYAAMPMFISLNASLLGSLLSPLLDAQDDLSGLPYAIQDLARLTTTALETGNMLIMAYAHARFSGDGSLIHQHYNLTKRWADYLVANALTPNEQYGSANQTNLALKGIVGIKTMAEISRALGQQFDAQQYDVHAAALIESWQSLALSTNKTAHVRGIYADAQSWVLLYNLYADRLLGTGLLSTSIQQEQTIFYKSLINPGELLCGRTYLYASMLFTAATALDDDVRDSLITGVWNRAAMTLVPGPFPGDHDVFSGQILDCAGGPAAGAMFSLLSLK